MLVCDGRSHSKKITLLSSLATSFVCCASYVGSHHLSLLLNLFDSDPVVEICGTNSIKLSKFNTKKVFECCFDSVMGATSSQADVYKIVEKCTSSVLEGTNSTIFAYGQTGSGKVHYLLVG